MIDPQVGRVMCTRCRRETPVLVHKHNGIVRYGFPLGWYIEYRGINTDPVFLCDGCGALPLDAP